MTDPRLDLAAALRHRAADIPHFNVVAGFDGFVDELIHIVEERQSLDSFRVVPSISRFAELIGTAAGKSSLREMVVLAVEAGGCAVNLGDGIATLGVKLDYFGTLGEPLHPAFAPFAAKCHSCHSFGVDPGHTLAFEFQDGKTMLSSMRQLADFTPARLLEKTADGAFAAALGRADLIALTNWTLYPHMTACWKTLQTDFLPALRQRPWLFLDLVDPRSRSRNDMQDMLAVLPGFERHTRCILGGNLNEANVLGELLGLSTVAEEGPEVAPLCAALREKLGISEVAIHCVAGAAVASDDGVVWVEGPYTDTPKKSTGAGDRYNAGYCLGRLLDLPPAQRCLLGAASSGFFVRNARSGIPAEICGLLETWAAGTL
jgi:sugar/nucleoside kinase (ribokinase family)